MEQRETVRCQKCELNQYKPASAKCVRCGNDLLTGTIETTRLVYLRMPPQPVSVMTMREVMQAAAVHAVQTIGYTTKAAVALAIPHGRLKQLLREAGDDNGRDHRFDSKKK